MTPVRITVLGSGTSVGVPMIGCHCKVCQSSDPRDARLRPSIAVHFEGHTVLIDAGPDFRMQALRAGLTRIDAVLLTHAHADHILGLDDLRPFNYKQKETIPIYATSEVIADVQRVFRYAFDDKPTHSTKPKLEMRPIDLDPIDIHGLSFLPIPVLHGPNRTTGWRFGSAAYLTDHNEIPESTLPLLEGLDVLFLDGLRYKPHATHSHIARSLKYVERLKPQRCYLTHICHDLPHARTESLLPPQVRLAYDGLEIAVGNAPVRASRPASKSFHVYWNLEDLPKDFGPSAVAIGNLDGVHVGHKEILRRTEQIAADLSLKPTVLTFHPHPKRLLRPDAAPLEIEPIARRLERIEAEGISQVLVLPFTPDIASLEAHDFIRRVLVEKLGARAILVGENFRFGRAQGGDVRLLRELGPKFGYFAEILEHVSTRGRIVSSSMIRSLLTEGNVSLANRLLGYEFSLDGPIISGHGIGHKQTVPTLNLAVAGLLTAGRLIPKQGVYVTQTQDLDNGRTWPSITNIGHRPTFAGTDLSIETFLLEPLADPTPARIRLEFNLRLRDEQKFPNPEELKSQILKDVRRAQNYWRRRSRLTRPLQDFLE